MGFNEKFVWCVSRQAGFWVFGLEEIVKHVFARAYLVATLLLGLFFDLSPLCDVGLNPLVVGPHSFGQKSVNQAIETLGFEPDP